MSNETTNSTNPSADQPRITRRVQAERTPRPINLGASLKISGYKVGFSLSNANEQTANRVMDKWLKLCDKLTDMAEVENQRRTIRNESAEKAGNLMQKITDMFEMSLPKGYDLKGKYYVDFDSDNIMVIDGVNHNLSDDTKILVQCTNLESGEEHELYIPVKQLETVVFDTLEKATEALQEKYHE